MIYEYLSIEEFMLYDSSRSDEKFAFLFEHIMLIA